MNSSVEYKKFIMSTRAFNSEKETKIPQMMTTMASCYTQVHSHADFQLHSGSLWKISGEGCFLLLSKQLREPKKQLMYNWKKKDNLNAIYLGWCFVVLSCGCAAVL